MKICPNCNQPVSDTAKFCGKCGFNIKKHEEENTIQNRFCTECGAKISSDLAFCTECGARLEENVSNDFGGIASFDSFDFSALESEAQTMLTESALSAFEYEQMSNGKYIIKKLKNKSELNIVVPECVEIIDEDAFAGSSVIDVTLPDGLIKIGARAFANCKDLETINIPSSLRIVEDEAFSGCKCLDLEQPKNVRCGKDAFKNTLPWIKKENERKRKEEEERKRKEAEERKRQEEERKRREAEERKRQEEERKRKEAEERKRREEEERKRKEEEERRRREEEERIRQAEEECRRRVVEEHKRQEEERKRREEEERIRQEEAERKRRYTSGLEFWKVKGKEAYGVDKYNGKSQNVVIPEIYNDLPVITIFPEAFQDCTSLKSITIPDSVRSIGHGAFSCCHSLTNIIIPDSLRTIRCNTFFACDSLKSITIPESVTNIEFASLASCSSLTKINYEGTVEQWEDINKEEDWDFGTGTCKIYCTDGTIIKYSNDY